MTITFTGKFGKDLHFFGLYGTLCFLLGFGISLYLILSKLFMAEFALTNKPAFFIALAIMVIGMQLFLAGFIAELVTRNAADRNTCLVDEKLGIN